MTRPHQAGRRAVLWQDGHCHDLNTQIARYSGWTLKEAHGINGAGQVVGEGVYQGDTRAFLLTPVAPASP